MYIHDALSKKNTTNSERTLKRDGEREIDKNLSSYSHACNVNKKNCFYNYNFLFVCFCSSELCWYDVIQASALRSTIPIGVNTVFHVSTSLF